MRKPKRRRRSAPAPIARNAELAALFEAQDKAELALSPLFKSYRGIKDADYGKWDEFTDEADAASRALDRQNAGDDAQPLRPRRAQRRRPIELRFVRLWCRPFADSLEPYRKQAYVFDQMNGAQSDGPAFLINIHRVDSAADAEAYVARLSAMARYLDQAIAEAKDRQARSILPPKWVFPYVIADSKNVISGAPFGRRQRQRLVRRFQSQGRQALTSRQRKRRN